jgi:NADH-quinone oxidoreductase subunit M
LGFVVLGIFALTQQSVQGAMMVMINHGISTGALFLLIGMLYERRHTRLIASYGGIARVVPLFSALLVIVSFSSIGLPATNGFVGEFLVLLGSFKTHPFFTLFATTAVIYAAAYLLWGIQGIVFNPLDKKENEHITDLNARELTIMGVLVVAIFWIGIYPQPILRRMESSSAYFVHSVEQGQADTRTASREVR